VAETMNFLFREQLAMCWTSCSATGIVDAGKAVSPFVIVAVRGDIFQWLVAHLC